MNGYGGLTIGDDTIIGPGSMIHTASHKMGDLDRHISGRDGSWRRSTSARACWIGMAVCILPGPRIGDGSVIGAGSVVVNDVESFGIAEGSPATVVRSRP